MLCHVLRRSRSTARHLLRRVLQSCHRLHHSLQSLSRLVFDRSKLPDSVSGALATASHSTSYAQSFARHSRRHRHLHDSAPLLLRLQSSVDLVRVRVPSHRQRLDDTNAASATRAALRLLAVHRYVRIIDHSAAQSLPSQENHSESIEFGGTSFGEKLHTRLLRFHGHSFHAAANGDAANARSLRWTSRSARAVFCTAESLSNSRQLCVRTQCTELFVEILHSIAHVVVLSTRFPPIGVLRSASNDGKVAAAFDTATSL